MNRHSGFIAAFFLICAAQINAQTVTIYVARNGRDTWSGRFFHAVHGGKDGPVATLEAARSAIAVLKQAQKPSSVQTHYVVVLEPGTYRITTTFKLGTNDGGDAGNPVVYRAMRPGTVTLAGGPTILSWSRKLPSDAARLFTSFALPHLLECSLTANGIPSPGDLEHRGFAAPTPALPVELFYKGRRMTLARWPAKGYMDTAAPISAKSFGYSGVLPPGIASDTDVWVHGYWNFDWAETYDKVGSVDLVKHVVNTSGTVSAYPYKADRRFYFVNVPGALTGPNQYYIDRASNTLYFWPPAGFSRSACRLSTLTAPLIAVNGTHDLVFSGCTLEADRGEGALVTAASHVVVRNCTLRDIGQNGIDFNNCTYCGLDGCHVYDIGDAGVGLFCGDRNTLTPGNCFVRNCSIHNYAQWDFTYHPGVMLNGVGNIVEHNEIYNSPHQAILFNGNNHLIQYNNFHNVCTETGDAGAVYDGRDLTQRGTIIRYNYFHDIVPTLKTPGNYDDVMSVYLDDCLCGTTIEDNIFDNAGHSIMVGGGRDNIVKNNLFINCVPSISVDARGLSWAKDWYASPNGIMLRRLNRVHYNVPPYSTAYPHLANILQDDPQAPKYDIIAGNLTIGGTWLFDDGVPARAVTIEGNRQFATAEAAGINPVTFAVQPDGQAAAMGFPTLPLRQMGPVKN